MIQTDKKIIRLRNKISRLSMVVPIFIDLNNSVDSVVFERFGIIYSVISRLTTNVVISDKKINECSDIINEEMEFISIISQVDLVYLVNRKIIKDLESFIDFCVDFELYETASNLHRFKSNI